MVAERLFDEREMYTLLERVAAERGFVQTARALPFAWQMHDGQTRKGSGGVPYVNHPLTVACHALALGWAEDALLAAALLHDVCEDCGVMLEELPVGDEAREAVRLLTKGRHPGLTLHEAAVRYYQELRSSRIAVQVKLLDRCCNVSTMAGGFTRTRMGSYVTETEEHVLPLLGYLREVWPEHAPAAFLLEYHMKSVMESIRALL